MEGFFDDLKDQFVPNSRVNDMQQVAKEERFNFRRKENFADQDYLLKSFQVFKGKKSKRLKGILRKKENELDAVIRMYDYIYWGDFKTKKTTIFEIDCPDLELPKFFIYPKGIINQVSSFFANKEKVFPDKIDFHTKFNIETSSKKELEEAIGKKLIQHLPLFPNISLEGEGDYLLIYFLGKQIPTPELMDNYDNVIDMLDMILNDNSNEFV